MRSADRLPLPAANARPKRNGNHFNNGQKTADDAFALCRARESLVQWYVAGQRVNLLLALSPSALQIDTLTDDEDLLLGFGASECFRTEVNFIAPTLAQFVMASSH